jgi:hypothetical protein
VLLTGGPSGDERVRGASFVPPEICQRKPGDAFRHFVHAGDDRYEYRGPCIEFHEGEPQPGDWSCCCGKPDHGE